MSWTLTGDLGDYLAAAGRFLRADPVQHTIELAAVEQMARGLGGFGSPGPLFGWWRPGDGPVTAAALHTPPYPVLVTPLPAGAAAALARGLLARGRALTGVNGSHAGSAGFAAAWAELTGAGSLVIRRSRLYRLGTLTPLAPLSPGPGPGRGSGPGGSGPGGAARRATAADRDLLIGWMAAFAAETGDSPGPSPAEIDDELSYGGLILWEADGVPVSVAGFKRPAAGVTRIGPVFTPPGQRRHGYAAAVTVAVTQAALDAGAAAVVLFTDLASPASNALYPRLGYQPVADRTMLGFTPGRPPGG
jgi:RimJ/RimL family protein N-acetyltransferase